MKRNNYREIHQLRFWWEQVGGNSKREYCAFNIVRKRDKGNLISSILLDISFLIKIKYINLKSVIKLYNAFIGDIPNTEKNKLTKAI